MPDGIAMSAFDPPPTPAHIVAHGGTAANRDDSVTEQYCQFYLKGEEEWLKIEIPGNTLSVYDQPVTDYHRMKYDKAYAAFKSGQMYGTSLEDVDWIPEPKRALLKQFNIATVEQLAAIPDSLTTPDMQPLKDQAEYMVKNRIAIAQGEKQTALEATVTEQQATIARLTERLDSLEKPKAAARK